MIRYLLIANHGEIACRIVWLARRALISERVQFGLLWM